MNATLRSEQSWAVAWHASRADVDVALSSRDWKSYEVGKMMTRVSKYQHHLGASLVRPAMLHARAELPFLRQYVSTVCEIAALLPCRGDGSYGTGRPLPSHPSFPR